MAFDKTLPTNTTKIRNYPTVLTDNFAGIQEGDLTFKVWQANFADRDLVPGAPPPAADPTRDDDTMIVFAKQNADAETDLFVLDDRSPANNYAITENGKLGGRATSLVTQDITFGTDPFVYTSAYLPTVWGSITGAGAVEAWSNGIASTSVVSSRRRVTFAAGTIVNTSYSVLVTPTTGGNTRIATWINKTATSVDIRITNQNNTDALVAFDIVIFGGK